MQWSVAAKPTRQIKTLALIASLFLSAVAMANDSNRHYQLNIPSQNIELALRQLADKTNSQLLFPSASVETLKSTAISGRYTLNRALMIILKGTPLSGELTEDGVIVITHRQKNSDTEGIDAMHSKKTLLAATVAFFAGGGVPVVVGQESVAEEKDGSWVLEEIVVTASKRETSLQDTALAISVLSEDTIDKRGLVDMNDYLATIPGASFIEFGATENKIVFRGISLDRNDPQGTASAYLGEIPISSALDSFDISLVDIDRIEVIKGPQGTLFGSNSLGGLVRTIPNAPNLNVMEGKLTLDVSTQDESDDLNHSVTGVVNVPLIEDQLALRIAAYNFSEAGYIDIVSSPAEEAVAAATGATAIVKDDSNSSTNKGVRASLLWQPTENLEVGLIYGVQNGDVDNTSFSLESLPGYQVSYLNTPAAQSTDLDYSNLLIEYDLSWATLLSSTSVLNNESSSVLNSYISLPTAFLGPTNSDTQRSTNLKTQEIRLASNLESQWEYVAGLFYEKSEVNTTSLFDWIGNPAMANMLFGGERLSHLQEYLDYEQKAIFGEISYEVSEQWLITLGGRHFQYDRVDISDFIGEGLLFNADDSEEDIGESGNIYKANLAFTPNENTLIYGQWSEGFRLGRGQTKLNAAQCDMDNDGILDGTDGVITSRVESDTTAGLELGLKLSLLDSRLTVNTAVFKTDWDNLPTTISGAPDTCVNSLLVNNIGSAESEGIEIDAIYLLDAWVLSLSASYVDTARTNTRPPLEEGERLSFAPQTNANAALQYNFTMNGYSGFIRTDLSYVGKYATAERWISSADAGDYVDASFRVGITMNHWGLTLYGTNLTGNDDARLSIGGNFGSPVAVTRAVPRRLGVKVDYNF